MRLASLCGAIVALSVLLLLGTSVSALGNLTPGSAVLSSAPPPPPTFIIPRLLIPSCRNIAGFDGNKAPTAGADFPLVPFLPSSVGYLLIPVQVGKEMVRWRHEY